MISLLIYNKNTLNFLKNIYTYKNKIVKIGRKKIMSFSKFSPFLSSVVRSWVRVLFEVVLFEVVSFEVKFFEVGSFRVQSFEVGSFEVQSFEVQSFSVGESSSWPGRSNGQLFTPMLS